MGNAGEKAVNTGGKTFYKKYFEEEENWKPQIALI